MGSNPTPSARAVGIIRRGSCVRGGMSERLKEHAWRACRRVSVSWVQIPLPPPYQCLLKLALGLKFGRARRGVSGAL